MYIKRQQAVWLQTGAIHRYIDISGSMALNNAATLRLGLMLAEIALRAGALAASHAGDESGPLLGW